MKRIALTAAAIAAFGLGACQQRPTTNNTTTANGTTSTTENSSAVVINSTQIGTSIENGLQDAGNLAGQVGDEIGNGARATYNAGRDVVRDIADGPDNQGDRTTNKAQR